MYAIKHILKSGASWVLPFYDVFNALGVRITRFVGPRKFGKRLDRNGLFSPSLIYLEVTNHCNAACIMCPHKKMKRGKGFMSWELFQKIIDELKTCGRKEPMIFLHLVGEPLMDPLLFRRIEYIKKNMPEAFVRLNTNAMLLDGSRARQLLDSGIDNMTFSINGASKEIYEKIGVGLDYEIVKKNLDGFFELKKRHPSRIKVIMQMVMCEENKHEVREYKRLWSGKADFVFIKPMHNFLDMGTSIKTKGMAEKQLNFCSQPFDTLLVYWNGDVGLCCWDYDHLRDLGNVAENRILDVYNNENFRKVRTAMCRMDCRAISPCNKCSKIYGHDIWV